MRTFSCIFFHLFGFHEIGFILVLKISCRKKSIKFHLTSFEFHGENEFSQDVYEYVIKVGGTIRKSVPNRSPSQEVFVGSAIKDIRELLKRSNMPTAAWPYAAFAIFNDRSRSLNIDNAAQEGKGPINQTAISAKDYFGKIGH